MLAIALAMAVPNGYGHDNHHGGGHDSNHGRHSQGFDPHHRNPHDQHHNSGHGDNYNNHQQQHGHGGPHGGRVSNLVQNSNFVNLIR